MRAAASAPWARPARGQHTPEREGRAHARPGAVRCNGLLDRWSRHAIADEVARGSLVELRTRLPRAPRRMAIAVRRNKRLGRAAEDFVRHCMA